MKKFFLIKIHISTEQTKTKKKFEKLIGKKICFVADLLTKFIGKLNFV